MKITIKVMMNIIEINILDYEVFLLLKVYRNILLVC